MQNFIEKNHYFPPDPQIPLRERPIIPEPKYYTVNNKKILLNGPERQLARIDFKRWDDERVAHLKYTDDKEAYSVDFNYILNQRPYGKRPYGKGAYNMNNQDWAFNPNNPAHQRQSRAYDEDVRRWNSYGTVPEGLTREDIRDLAETPSRTNDEKEMSGHGRYRRRYQKGRFYRGRGIYDGQGGFFGDLWGGIKSVANTINPLKVAKLALPFIPGGNVIKTGMDILGVGRYRRKHRRFYRGRGGYFGDAWKWTKGAAKEVYDEGIKPLIKPLAAAGAAYGVNYLAQKQLQNNKNFIRKHYDDGYKRGFNKAWDSMPD